MCEYGQGDRGVRACVCVHACVCMDREAVECVCVCVCVCRQGGSGVPHLWSQPTRSRSPGVGKTQHQTADGAGGLSSNMQRKCDLLLSDVFSLPQCAAV